MDMLQGVALGGGVVEENDGYRVRHVLTGVPTIMNTSGICYYNLLCVGLHSPPGISLLSFSCISAAPIPDCEASVASIRGLDSS